MGYFGANAISISHTTKKITSFTDFEKICGAGVFINKNTFRENIGARFSDGGALVTRCLYIKAISDTYVLRNIDSGLIYDSDNIWES